jgi:hypothetical protein
MASVRDIGIEAGPEAVQPIDRHAEVYGLFLNHAKGFCWPHLLGIIVPSAGHRLV